MAPAHHRLWPVSYTHLDVYKRQLKGFPCEDAASLCDAMRRLVGWQEIRYELEKYIEKQVQELSLIHI